MWGEAYPGLYQEACALLELGSVVVAVPYRGPRENGVELEQLRLVLALPSCVGCLGGTKKKGYFIVGCHENHVLALDPHYVQAEWHTGHAARLPIESLSSTLCFCFLLDQSGAFKVPYCIYEDAFRGVDVFVVVGMDFMT